MLLGGILYDMLLCILNKTFVISQGGCMFDVKSIMNKNIITVSADTHIYEAINMLLTHKISGLPVVKPDMTLEGIITEKDILTLLIDSSVDENQTVADFMTKNVKTFMPNDSAVMVCEFLLAHPYRRVPIVEDGKLVGIVARRDILSLIVKMRGKNREHA